MAKNCTHKGRFKKGKVVFFVCFFAILAVFLFHLWSLLGAVLQHCVENLHVVGIPGVGQLVEDHQLHHGAQVVSVRIEQLPGESAANHQQGISCRFIRV